MLIRYNNSDKPEKILSKDVTTSYIQFGAFLKTTVTNEAQKTQERDTPLSISTNKCLCLMIQCTEKSPIYFALYSLLNLTEY